MNNIFKNLSYDCKIQTKDEKLLKLIR